VLTRSTSSLSGDDIGDVAQQTLAIKRFQHNIHFKCRTSVEHPFGRHPARGVGTFERGAVGAVHGDPASDRGVGDDGLGRPRLAAACQRQRDVAQPRNGDGIV